MPEISFNAELERALLDLQQNLSRLQSARQQIENAKSTAQSVIEGISDLHLQYRQHLTNVSKELENYLALSNTKLEEHFSHRDQSLQSLSGNISQLHGAQIQESKTLHDFLQTETTRHLGMASEQIGRFLEESRRELNLVAEQLQADQTARTQASEKWTQDLKQSSGANLQANLEHLGIFLEHHRTTLAETLQNLRSVYQAQTADFERQMTELKDEQSAYLRQSANRMESHFDQADTQLNKHLEGQLKLLTEHAEAVRKQHDDQLLEQRRLFSDLVFQMMKNLTQTEKQIGQYLEGNAEKIESTLRQVQILHEQQTRITQDTATSVRQSQTEHLQLLTEKNETYLVSLFTTTKEQTETALGRLSDQIEQLRVIHEAQNHTIQQHLQVYNSFLQLVKDLEERVQSIDFPRRFESLEGTISQLQAIAIQSEQQIAQTRQFITEALQSQQTQLNAQDKRSRNQQWFLYIVVFVMIIALVIQAFK